MATVTGSRKNRRRAPSLYKLHIASRNRLDGDQAAWLAEGLEDMAAAVFLHNKDSTDGDDWTVTFTIEGRPDLREVRRRLRDLESSLKSSRALKGLKIKGLTGRLKLRSGKLPRRNWLQHVHDNFPPVRAGRFFIRGSHFRGATPPGLTALHIDAAMAFGSGEHATTKGCLRALEKLSGKHEFRRALDMGCGSGILAIAMAKLWPRLTVTAIDIDPESAAVTRRHAAMNRVRLAAAAGDGYKAALAEKNAPYDLIAANILAGPLIAMAPACRRALKKGGFCVLSGLLKRQQADVTRAYENQGFVAETQVAAGDWRTLVFRRP